MRRAVLAAVVVGVVTALTPVASAGPAERPGRPAGAAPFHQTRCPAGTFPDRLDVDCGYLVVPEDRDHPDGRKIHVAVAVVHAEPGAPHGDPILFLPGGPSAGAITRGYVRAYFAGDRWTAGHDVVLVDTRGVGHSTPRLGCPEVDAADVTSFYSGPSIASRAVPIYTAALRQCRSRLEGEGIDVDAYTVEESVADLESLRSALGVTRWNLMAVSADGILGMSYLRDHPDRVRSVVVDSGMPAQMDAVTDYDRGASRNLDRVFSGCAAAPTCARAYPRLGPDFLRLVARLNRHPERITFRDYQPHPVRLTLDGSGLYFDISRSIFAGNLAAPEGIHHLMDQIWRMSHGQLRQVYREMFGQGPTPNADSDRFLALGRTMSLECSAVTDFSTPRVRADAARALPMYARRYRSRDFDLGDSIGEVRSPAGCRVWGVPRAPAAQHRPVVSDVPVLVLAGEYDESVPASVVRKNLAGLSSGTFVQFPASGHLQLASFTRAHRCARSIVTGFLRHPATSPDLGCVAELPAFDYTVSAARGLSEPSGPLPWPRGSSAAAAASVPTPRP